MSTWLPNVLEVMYILSENQPLLDIFSFLKKDTVFML